RLRDATFSPPSGRRGDRPARRSPLPRLARPHVGPRRSGARPRRGGGAGSAGDAAARSDAVAARLSRRSLERRGTGRDMKKTFLLLMFSILGLPHRGAAEDKTL